MMASARASLSTALRQSPAIANRTPSVPRSRADAFCSSVGALVGSARAKPGASATTTSTAWKDERFIAGFALQREKETPKGTTIALLPWVGGTREKLRV